MKTEEQRLKEDLMFYGGLLAGTILTLVTLAVVAQSVPGKEFLLDWIFYIG